MPIGDDLGLSNIGGCACGEAHSDLPELDARVIPHAIRHASIKGALSSLSTGSAMVLVAPHNPVPLLHQIEAETPGAFAVDYLTRGPDTWRLQFTRH